MAPINAAVVMRTSALLEEKGEGYGRDFSYKERLYSSRKFGWLLAHAVTALSLFFFKGPQYKLLRNIIEKLAPKPGEGPSIDAQKNGYFKCKLIGITNKGQKKSLTLSFKGDPGNRATVCFASQAALALLLDGAALEDKAGILTPASCLGEVYVKRLLKAGMEWSFE